MRGWLVGILAAAGVLAGLLFFSRPRAVQGGRVGEIKLGGKTFITTDEGAAERARLAALSSEEFQAEMERKFPLPPKAPAAGLGDAVRKTLKVLSPKPAPVAASSPPPNRSTPAIKGAPELDKFPDKYDPIIVRASRRYGVPPAILKATLAVESGLNPAATGDGGAAHGIAQFHAPTWADTWPGGDPYNPQDAIPAAAKYLSQVDEWAGAPGWADALQAYNGGIGNFQRGTVSDDAVNYSRKVLELAGMRQN